MRSIYLLDNRANTAGAMETKQAGLGSFLMTVRTRTGIPVSRASPIITAAATATFCMAVTVSVNEKESVSSPVSLSPSHRIIARYDNPSSRFVLTPFVLTSEPGKGGGVPPSHSPFCEERYDIGFQNCNRNAFLAKIDKNRHLKWHKVLILICLGR